MATPKMKDVEVTTMQDVLTSNYGNQAITARELGINRGTLRTMIADDRPNVVLVGENGEYTLLK